MLQPGAFFSIDSNAGLGNPDAVRLFDAGGTMIDSYAYDDHAGHDVRALPRRHRCVRQHRGADAGRGERLSADRQPVARRCRGLDPRRRGHVRRERQRAGLPAVRHGRAGRAVGRAQLRTRPRSSAWCPTGRCGRRPRPAATPRRSSTRTGLGAPDAEGVTLADGDPNARLRRHRARRWRRLAAEDPALRHLGRRARRCRRPTSGTSRPTCRGWAPTSGLEAIAFVPDTLLVAKGLIDDAGREVQPGRLSRSRQGPVLRGRRADRPGDRLRAEPANDTFKRITTIASTFRSVMELEYEPETTHLWAMCDNNCDGRSVTLDIDAGHRQVRRHAHVRPPRRHGQLQQRGLRDRAAGGVRRTALKPTFYAEDSDADGHTLRGGTINCTPLPPVVDPDPTPDPDAATGDPVADTDAGSDAAGGSHRTVGQARPEALQDGRLRRAQDGQVRRHDHARRAVGPDDLRDGAQERQGEGAHDPEGDHPQGRGRGQADASSCR